MTLYYPTVYKDSRGIEKSMFISDGKSLRITLRGITFQGHFWELSPVADPENKALELFDLREFTYFQSENIGYELSGIVDCAIGESSYDFSVDVQMPIKIITNKNLEIDAVIEFGTNEYGKLNFKINGEYHEFQNPNFEYGLAAENTKSLNIKYIKCCINCQFGEYSPFGNQDYGDMICFKNCKEEWSKIGYTGLKDLENREIVKDYKITTQEAYWCDEFKLKE